MMDLLRNQMAVTLQVTVAELGFMPDDCGAGVKKILAEDDVSAILALGCYLDDARKNKSYEILSRGLVEISEAQAARV